MFAYDELVRFPSAFRSLTGMTAVAFENLLTAFLTAQGRCRQGRRTMCRGQPRQRAAGAGHPFRHDARHRLLMALVWLRVYPTYELLGFFFGLHKRNAQLNVRDVLATLETLDDFPFDRPDRDRKKLRSVAEVMAAFPEVRVVDFTPGQQGAYLRALNRMVDQAHARGLQFRVGLWDHIYRGGVQSGVSSEKWVSTRHAFAK